MGMRKCSTTENRKVFQHRVSNSVWTSDSGREERLIVATWNSVEARKEQDEERQSGRQQTWPALPLKVLAE